MIYLPFIYFTCLSFFFYKRRSSVDIATIISMMYAISGFFSILLYKFDSSYYDISFIPAILYCFLLTICILPISKFNILNSRLSLPVLSPVRKVRLLKLLSILSFIWILLVVILGRDTLIYVLTSDLADTRADINAGYGVGTWLTALPQPLRLVIVVLNILFGCSWVLELLAFYTMSDSKFPIIYSYFFLAASLFGPLNGMMGADRSATAYWIISLIALYSLFHKGISAKRKKFFGFIALLIGLCLFAYLSAITISRFENNDSVGGVEGSLIRYFGLPYLNFCHFFDNYQLPYTHWGVLFPFVSEFLFGIPAGATVINADMSRLSNMETGTFYTFIGHFMVGLGQFKSIIITILYAIWSYFSLRAIYRKRVVNIRTIYLFFAFASVVLLGLFVHFYSGYTRTFSLVFMYFLIKYISKA